MTAIPPTATPAVQIAGSASAANRRDALTERAGEAAAHQRLAADQQELAARSLGDVGETDQSADRDADGRRLDTPDAPPDGSPDASEPPGDPPRRSSRAADAFGERGGLLDCEA